MKIMALTTVSLRQGVDWGKPLLSISNTHIHLPLIWVDPGSGTELPLLSFVHTRPKACGIFFPFFGFFGRKVVPTQNSVPGFTDVAVLTSHHTPLIPSSPSGR